MTGVSSAAGLRQAQPESSDVCKTGKQDAFPSIEDACQQAHEAQSNVYWGTQLSPSSLIFD